MRYLLALTFVLPVTSLLPVAAHAQAPPDSVAWERFFPAQVGDEWEYEYIRMYCPGQGLPCPPADTTYRRFVVTGDTLIDGDRLPIFESARARCAIRATNGNGFEVHRLSGELGWCLSVENTTVRDMPHDPQGVAIGGTSYVLDATIEVSEGGGLYYNLYGYGADVGLYFRHEYSQFTQGEYTSYTYSLLYAKFGGVEYGTSVVATEGGEPADPTPALVVYPNPVSETVRAAFTLLHPGPARVEVADLLGRIVLGHDLGALPTGRFSRTLDLSTLSSGVYLLRVVLGDGTVVARPLTRVE
jgi:hypothetical protein